MKYSILLVYITLSASCFSQKTGSKSPEELTLAFIKDYFEWNEYAVRTDKVSGGKGSGIERNYRKIIRKYCIPGKDYQGVAYGSVSNHHPEHEKIVDKEIGASKAIIKTQFNDEDRPYKYAEYEYHFLVKGGKWLLEEVYYLDQKGKHNSL